MPKVSVIVPVYKVEDYLPQCIESIIHQTFSDMEIILVDDGSPDRCGQICDEYAAKDHRIMAIHQNNAGLSDARNAGIRAATGDYLSFIDSDDWVEEEMLWVMVQAAEKSGTDIVACGRINDYTNAASRTGFSKSEKTVWDRKEAIRQLLLGEYIDVAAWDKLYRKELFAQIRFPSGELHEDMAVMDELFLRSNGCVHCGKNLYHYQCRSGSITKSNFDERNAVAIRNVEKTKALLENMGLNAELERYCYWTLSKLYGRYLLSDEETGKPYRSILRDMLKKNGLSIMKNRYISVKDKAVIVLQLTGIYPKARRLVQRSRGF